MKNRIDAEKQPVLWAGFHQLESVLKALNMSLNGNVFPAPHNEKPIAWLKSQGFEEVLEFSPIWSAVFGGFEARFGTSIESYVSSYFSPGPGMANFGEERSGAGWRDPANFLITSAFIRVLATWEQFELDVLRALFYYRPGGVMGPESEQIEETVDYRLIGGTSADEGRHEMPLSQPAIWEWIEKTAQNNEQRRQIFAKVFKIDRLSPDCDGAKELRNVMYLKRNQIVHGRSGVTMSLSEFLDYASFVAKSMDYVADRCKVVLRVSL